MPNQIKRLTKKVSKQWVLCCYAFSFFSRLPVAKSLNFSAYPFYLGNAYLPVVGLCYALCCCAIFFVSQTVFNPIISVIFMLVAGLLLTGAFHEDGFADSCDGFGGGYSKQQCLTIMKDSQIGAYGVIGLILLFALKIAVLSELATLQGGLFFAIIGCAAMVSRFTALCLMQYSQYARLDESSKVASSTAPLPIKYLTFALCFSILPFVLLVALSGKIMAVTFMVAIVSLSTFLCKTYFEQKIEGYTGDCLGFLQQTNELLILLIALVLLG
jgi:adenosylcobinamide-GDP ribazoletransferase